MELNYAPAMVEMISREMTWWFYWNSSLNTRLSSDKLAKHFHVSATSDLTRLTLHHVDPIVQLIWVH